MKRINLAFTCLIFALLIGPAWDALAETIKMVLAPEKITGEQCNPHPQFGTFNIKKIAVLAFENSVKDKNEKFEPSKLGHNIQAFDVYVYLGANDGAAVAGMFEQALVQSYKYSVIERRQIQKVLGEHAFSQTGFVGNEEASKVGKLLSADAVIFGKVINAYSHLDVKLKGASFMCTYVATAALDVRMVNVATGEIVWNCNISRNSLNYLDKKMTITNNDVVSNPHIFDIPLHGSTPEERLTFVLRQMAGESIKAITQ